MQVVQRMAGWAQARPFGAVVGIFGLALVIRLLAFAMTHRTLPAGDELELFVRAARAVIGPPIEDDAGRAPGLQLFYETAFRLFRVHAAVAKLANVAVSSLTVIPVAAIGRRLGGPRVGLVAALGVALYPTYVAFSHYLWPAPLYILLVTSGVALLLAFASATGWRAVAGLGAAGAVLGASALVKEAGLSFPPVAACWLVWVSRAERGRALVRGAAVAVGAAAVVVPWVVHIQRPDLPFALVTRTGYMNLFIGNHPQGHGVGMAQYPTLGATRLEAERVAGERALAEIRRRMPAWPLEKIATEVPRFFTPTSFAVRRLLTPPGDPGGWGYRMSWSVLDRPTPRAACAAVVVLAYLIASTCGAAGLVLARRTELTLLFALFIASQIAPSIVTFAMSRFRLASMAFLIVGAASLRVNGRAEWASATPRRRAAALGVALLLLGLAGLDYSAVLEPTGR